MDITGKLHLKRDIEQVSEKFKKREFILLDDSSQYPQYISFTLTQDKCNLIDQYAVGAEIKVHFNLRGREWTSPQGEVKYFNTLEAWRLEGVIIKSPSEEYHDKNKSENTYNYDKVEDSDLPF